MVRSTASIVLALAIGLTGCGGLVQSPVTPGVAPSSPVRVSAPPDGTTSSPAPSDSGRQEGAVLVAAGDIASCEVDTDSATARLIEGIPDATVVTLGDNVYPSGTAETYDECYAPAWGGFLDRTRPAIGNHDVEDDRGAAYFDFFGRAAGPPDEGWYSFDVGDWHVIALNSMCQVVGCEPGSPQHDWLVADLAETDSRCVLAYWHHPRFSSGPHGDTAFVTPFWRALHDAGADVVLVGHDHLYERMAPQRPGGAHDPETGIRQFTVGTGGKELYAAEGDHPNSEVIIDDAYGVLRLDLRASSYEWRFLTVDGVVADEGSDRCH